MNVDSTVGLPCSQLSIGLGNPASEANQFLHSLALEETAVTWALGISATG